MRQYISVLEGLRLAGYEIPKSGVLRGRVMVSYKDSIRVKTYSFRRRAGDGHVMTRRGRLTCASVLSTCGLVVFYLD